MQTMRNRLQRHAEEQARLWWEHPRSRWIADLLTMIFAGVFGAWWTTYLFLFFGAFVGATEARIELLALIFFIYTLAFGIPSFALRTREYLIILHWRKEARA